MIPVTRENFPLSTNSTTDRQFQLIRRRLAAAAVESPMPSSVVSRPGSVEGEKSPSSAWTAPEVMAPLAMSERSSFAERSRVRPFDDTVPKGAKARLS
jgi:hypothetical protein